MRKLLTFSAAALVALLSGRAYAWQSGWRFAYVACLESGVKSFISREYGINEEEQCHLDLEVARHWPDGRLRKNRMITVDCLPTKAPDVQGFKIVAFIGYDETPPVRIQYDWFIDQPTCESVHVKLADVSDNRPEVDVVIPVRKDCVPN